VKRCISQPYYKRPLACFVLKRDIEYTLHRRILATALLPREGLMLSAKQLYLSGSKDYALLLLCLQHIVMRLSLDADDTKGPRRSKGGLPPKQARAQPSHYGQRPQYGPGGVWQHDHAPHDAAQPVQASRMPPSYAPRPSASPMPARPLAMPIPSASRISADKATSEVTGPVTLPLGFLAKLAQFTQN